MQVSLSCYAALFVYRFASLHRKPTTKISTATYITRHIPAFSPDRKSWIMPRRNPNMTITTNAVVKQTFLLSPTPTTTTFHASSNTFPVFSGAQAFLLSPTVTLSPTSFRTDSPVLPPSPSSPTLTLFHANHVLRTSRSTEDLPAYPIPRTCYNGSTSSLDSSGSLYGDLNSPSARPVREESWGSQTTRMSDILPDDLDLYGEDEEEENKHGDSLDTRNFSIALTGAAQDAVREQDEKLQHVRKTEQTGRPATEVTQRMEEAELGPEVQGSLPVIREGDHPYYPLPSHCPQPRVKRDVQWVVPLKGGGVAKRSSSDSAGCGNHVRNLLRRLFRRRG